MPMALMLQHRFSKITIHVSFTPIPASFLSELYCQLAARCFVELIGAQILWWANEGTSSHESTVYQTWENGMWPCALCQQHVN